MLRGRFITLEGIEGVGKSTQAGVVVNSLRAWGYEVLHTREPGGTELGEAIRGLVLSHRKVDPRSELLLIFAARAQHIAEVIEPALQAGQWVVCERFTDATYAYQGGGRGIDQTMISQLEGWVQGALRPDVTFWLDVPVEAALERIVVRGAADRFERENVEFFHRVRAAYAERTAQDASRMIRVDGSREPAVVSGDLMASLQRLRGAGA